MKNRGIAFKLTSMILVVSVIFFLVVSNHNSKKIRSIFKGNLKDSAKNLSFSTLNKIESILKAVEKVPQQIAISLEASTYTKEDLLSILRQTVHNNSEIYGSTIAFEPYMFDPNELYFAPYFYKHKDEVRHKYIGSESYKYFSWDWYKIPKETNNSMWSEPYYDEGAGNIIMSTFSVPFYRNIKGERKLAGVVTADISLKWLQEMVSSIKIAETGYAFLISKKGTVVTHPKQELIMNQSITSLGEKFNRPRIHKLEQVMENGETILISEKHLFTSEDIWLFHTPLPSNGWSLGVIFPKEELLIGVNKLQMELKAFVAVGMSLLMLVIWFIARSITRPLGILTNATEQMATGKTCDLVSKIDSKDEVGRLAKSFCAMEREINNHIQQIEDISKLPGENPNPIFRAGATREVLYANKAAGTVLKDWNIKVGNSLPVIFHESIETALSLKENQKLELGHGDKLFNFELMPVVESAYINIYGRDITKVRKAEKQLEKMTLERNRIESEVKLATLVQEGFLPESPPNLPKYEFSAHTVPAKFVGGDFYDFIELDSNQLGIVLGDVSGKGVSAALFMARLMSDIRYVSLIDPDPVQVISQLNNILVKRSRKGMFATASYLLLDVENRMLKICNAGHHALMIRRDGNILEAGKAGGIPLGIMENSNYIGEDFSLLPGDLVFLYSDGAVEPVNPQMEQFGMERIQSILLKSEGKPEETLKEISDSIKQFTQDAPQFDDMTFLMFKVH
jgi:serine phosphatase RsbU (regulator of sigma subunit)/HAMP domain-containing protein